MEEIFENVCINNTKRGCYCERKTEGRKERREGTREGRDKEEIRRKDWEGRKK